MNEIKATQKVTSPDRLTDGQPAYTALDERKRQVIDQVKRQAELLRPGNTPRLGTNETLKLMAETQQNCMEFMKNKKVISRFDPNRKELLV